MVLKNYKSHWNSLKSPRIWISNWNPNRVTSWWVLCLLLAQSFEWCFAESPMSGSRRPTLLPTSSTDECRAATSLRIIWCRDCYCTLSRSLTFNLLQLPSIYVFSHFCLLSLSVTFPLYSPCGLRGCKNGPAPFPGRMSYKATKPGLVCLSYLSMLYYCIVVY